jgi:hypothetical protein
MTLPPGARYHWSPGQCDDLGPYKDFSNSTSASFPRDIAPSSRYLNGTYNAHVFTAETVRLIRANGGRRGERDRGFRRLT